MSSKICYGCGARLQSTDIKKKGYIPEKKLENSSYCMRCFRMIHYGENAEVETPKEAKEIINKINKDVKFVIFLVDFININNEVIEIFNSIKKRKLLVVNKCELIPRHIKRERIVSFLKNYYAIKDPIRIKGGTSTHGAKTVLNYLEDEDITEAYILGISNSGKSTLINDLMDLCGTKKNKVTVNNKANTTLDFIRVSINDDLTLIDSPGFILKKSLDNDVSGKNITAYSMNMKECETVSLLDDKYFIKFDAATPITFYTNAKAKKAIKKYFKAAPGLSHKIDIVDGKSDVVIPGIGFISVKKPVSITTNIDEASIEVRDSMFGGSND